MNILLRTYITIVIAIAYQYVAYAIPAYYRLHTHIQPDGKSITYYLRGDEYKHSYFTKEGYMLYQTSEGAMCYVTFDNEGNIVLTTCLAHEASEMTNEEKSLITSFEKIGYSTKCNSIMRQKKRKQNNESEAFPTTGKIRGLVILVEFADNSFYEEYTQSVFNSAMNEEEFSMYGATGSAKDYFTDQSMGLFQPSFDVIGPVKLSNKLSYYGQNSTGFMGYDLHPAEMVVEACQIAHDQFGTDFSQYDNDNDGNVDFIYIIYAGYGESYGAPSYTIWPHAANINDYYQYLTLDGKSIGKYACSCELKNTTGNTLEGIGTFCHEFSHILGLPDFYQTNGGGYTQLGSWSIMDSGCYNNESRTPASYSAFERYSLGWLEFKDIEKQETDIELPELTENNIAYRLTTEKENEYFILENRQQKNWDAYLPATGLMISHVDYNQSIWNNNSVNNDNTHPRYDLEEADGSQGVYYEGDLFPGNTNNTRFTDDSQPGALQWDGTRTNKAITNIRNKEGMVYFDFMQDKLTKPIMLEPTNITDSSFTANWQKVNGVSSYTLAVYEIVPDSIQPLAINEDFELMTKGNYPSADTTDISGNIDAYTKTKGWSGNVIFQAGGLCKIGNYGVSGRITTPSTDMTMNNGIYTIAFTAKSYPGKGVNYRIYSSDTNTGNTIEEYTFKGNSTGDSIVLVMHGGTKHTTLTIETSNERLYIGDLRMLRGEVDSTYVWNITNPQQIFTDLTEESYTVTGLKSGHSYQYAVRAMSNDEFCHSEYSDTLTVKMKDIQTNILNESTHGCILTVQGNRIFVHNVTSYEHIRIYDMTGKIIYSEKVKEDTEIDIGEKGLYIIMTNNRRLKLFITK